MTSWRGYFVLILCGWLSQVQASSMTFDVINTASRPHPRTLDVNMLSGSVERVSTMRKIALERPRSSLPAEPTAPLSPGSVVSPSSVQQAAFRAEEDILRYAIAGVALGDEVLIVAAKDRALKLAAWAPRGVTGYFNNDFAGMSVTWTLALVYDWLFNHLNEEEKGKLLHALRPRVEDILSPPVKGLPTGWAGLDWGRKMDRWPYDSHGAVTIARLAVICTIMAGADALYDRCTKEIVPRYLARPIPWGGSNGGYANGTAYAQWDVLYTHFIVWHLLKNSLGLSLWQIDWAKGYLNYLAYFLPPGTPSGLFGSETERRNSNVWATQAKAYAAALPSPLADWYARQHFGESVTHLALLLAPPRDLEQRPGDVPSGTPHAMLLADIGWAAMHSDLGDRSRTSMYFKSSPFGSYNHSHADQNSFVIHARGRALAIDSGYYDYYGSHHWSSWYKQTRAHNAITFDGGQGQSHDTMEAKGRITHFEHRPEYDSVTGDATQAYGGALTRSVRSLVYLRPDTLLVFDSLASDIPRTWEWNIHALSRMKENGGRSMEIEHDGVRLCVTMLEAPQGAFDQTDRFTAAPQGKYPPQWHARYASRDKTKQAEFVVSLVVGCQSTPSIVAKPDSGWIVVVDGRRLAFRAGKVESFQ